MKIHGKTLIIFQLRIYVNKIENRITFKIKTGHYFELLTPKTIKVFGSTKLKISKDKNGENVPNLEITEPVLLHCNIINDDYQQGLRVLCTFVPNKLFGYFLGISPKKFLSLKTFGSHFSYIDVWFPYQTSKPLEKINITLVTNQRVKYKK